MKALVLERERESGRRVVRLWREWPDPPGPGPEEVLVRMKFSGLSNGTERNWMLRGNYAPPDEALPCLQIGYQAVGVVEAVGTKVEGIAPGDWIFCGDFVGHVERFTARPQQLLIRLPSTMALEEAALLGIASVAVHCVRRADIRLGERALVVGLGPVGLLLIQVAAHAGAQVTALDLLPDRVAVARSLEVCEEAACGEVEESRDAFDVVIDAAGGLAVERLIATCRPRGRILLVAGRPEVRYPFNPGQLKEIAILQSGHFQQEDLELAVALVLSRRLRISPILREIGCVDEAEHLYQRLRDAPHTLLGTVLRWELS